MAIIRDPILRSAAVAELHPTQITVGMREVRERRTSWRNKGKKKRTEFLGKHLIPVILGPDKRQYIVDHHHLARALHDEDVKQVLVTVLENLSGLEPEAFWFVLENRGFTHPYDENGHRCACADIPRSVRKLIDDPFRSLASELRRVGGFAKETMSFSEFLWADFLRRRIERKLIESDFNRAIEKALELAQDPGANYLPGWCGPVPAD
jgi:hypothetical protein